MQTFDKNSDGIVSETEMTTRAELAFKVIAILVGITLDACNILIFNKTALSLLRFLSDPCNPGGPIFESSCPSLSETFVQT